MSDFIQNVNLSWDNTESSPLLAGDLNVNGNNIVSVSNGDINLVPDGTGKVRAANLSVTGNTFSSINGQPITLDELLVLKSYTVAQLQAITPATGSLAYCSNETGGAQPVFFDGSDWRKFTDRTVIA